MVKYRMNGRKRATLKEFWGEVSLKATTWSTEEMGHLRVDISWRISWQVYGSDPKSCSVTDFGTNNFEGSCSWIKNYGL